MAVCLIRTRQFGDVAKVLEGTYMLQVIFVFRKLGR